MALSGGGAPPSTAMLVNPIDTDGASTLAAFDADGGLLAHVLGRPPPPLSATRWRT